MKPLPVVNSVSARAFIDDDRCRFRPSTKSGVRLVARLTGRCTFLCEHCLASAAGNLRSEDLSVDTWKSILAEVRQVGVHKVLLTGGEPMLFKGLVELVAYIAAMDVTTDLNSTLWSMTSSLAIELAQAGLTEASVAIEGPEDVHDQMHGRPGARRRLFAGVEMLQEAGILVDGSMCVTPANVAHVRSTIKEAAHLGLGSMTISRMMPVGHGLHFVGNCVSDRELAGVHGDLAEARAGAFGISVRCVGLLGSPRREDCSQGRSLIGIRADGSLTPCVLSRDFVAGLPLPEEVGLSEAVVRMREALERTTQTFCYGPMR